MKCPAKTAFVLVAIIATVALFSLTACGSKPQLTTEELLKEKDAWAEEVIRDSLGKLADKGAIDPVASDAKLLDEAFTYEKTDSGYDIAFKDAQTKSQVTGGYELASGKVAICCINDGIVDLCFADGKHISNPGSTNNTPFFYPESAHDYLSMESVGALLEAVPQKAFADDFDTCSFLIVFDKVVTNVEKGYYPGNIDRESATTFVVVIDVQSHKVLHIENVGTDTPANSVQMGRNAGVLLEPELVEYLEKLLAA